MSVQGYSRKRFLDELNEPIDDGSGVITPSQQRARVFANIFGDGDIGDLGDPGLDIDFTISGDFEAGGDITGGGSVEAVGPLIVPVPVVAIAGLAAIAVKGQLAVVTDSDPDANALCYYDGTAWIDLLTGSEVTDGG